MVVAIFPCHPVSTLWSSDPQAIKKLCINLPRYFYGTQIPNTILDVVLMVLPLPYIWNLQMARFQKIGLFCVFLLSSL